MEKRSRSESNAKFKFTDARIVRFKELERVAFATVMVSGGRFPDWHEFVVFEKAAFPLVEGLAVTVVGDIQKRKPKEGSKDWKVEFIARQITKGDDSKAPRPKRSGERQQEMPADDDINF